MNISRTIPIFLITTILVFGTTISMGIPTSFAQSYYNDQQYKGYEDFYGKDYDKSSGLNLQKVNCNNINTIIINGIDKAGHQPAGDMLGGMTGEDDGTWQQHQWPENGERNLNDFDRHVVNNCINKNTILAVGDKGEETTCENCFTDNLQLPEETIEELCQQISEAAASGNEELLQEASNQLFKTFQIGNLDPEAFQTVLACLNQVFNNVFPQPQV